MTPIAKKGLWRDAVILMILIAVVIVAAWMRSSLVYIAIPVVALLLILALKNREDKVAFLTTRSGELSALLDLSQMMDAAFDLDMTLNLVMLNVQETSHCQVCAVYLTDRTGDTLELKGASGQRNRVNLLPSMPLATACCGHWDLSGHPLPGQTVDAFYTEETVRNPLVESCSLFQIDPPARSFACLPLTGIDGVLGMLYLGFDMPNGLTDRGISIIESLATRAAFPLQRVLLQQGFRSLAYSDSKTGLDNFRQFEISLVSELNRAERYGHRLSVILVDIDHFKMLNDTYGHPAGDAVLAQLAEILRSSLRSPDKPARFGGEEFVIVCPETGKDEARLVSERIRRNVANTRFSLVQQEGDSEAPTTGVTVSVGFATFPLDARNAQELTQKADEALYAAKHSGRNAVRGYDDSDTKLLMH